MRHFLHGGLLARLAPQPVARLPGRVPLPAAPAGLIAPARGALTSRAGSAARRPGRSTTGRSRTPSRSPPAADNAHRHRAGSPAAPTALPLPRGWTALKIAAILEAETRWQRRAFEERPRRVTAKSTTSWAFAVFRQQLNLAKRRLICHGPDRAAPAAPRRSPSPPTPAGDDAAGRLNTYDG